ncbi:endonuclease domain-containing protein [Gordonia sp. DT30]|uniref:endonuclease domain-containing protein n=1 Tax=unclassified Gordonia (in: high G+C Gram-positive bacteria) TaxID=2657482 RepID=UPI003CEF8D81
MDLAALAHDETDHWRGVFDYAELSRRGFIQSNVKALVRDGTLRCLRRSWYATVYAHPAVVQAVTAGGVCSCVTALDLHGVWVMPTADIHLRGRRTAANRGKRPLCRQHGEPLPERYPLDDVPTALRHALRCLPGEEIIAACDSILRQGLLEMADLEVVFASAPARTRELLARCDGVAESGAESIFGSRIGRKGIRFRMQVEIEGVGRVDFLIGRRLIVEIDSERFHDRTPEQRERDRQRDAEAIRRGYLPIRFSFRKVMYQWPTVEGIIDDLIRRRAHIRAVALPGELARVLEVEL